MDRKEYMKNFLRCLLRYSDAPTITFPINEMKFAHVLEIAPGHKLCFGSRQAGKTLSDNGIKNENN